MINKGDKVRITGNSIFRAMGYQVVTGTVFMKHSEEVFAFRCDQTCAMERCDTDDGHIEIVK